MKIEIKFILLKPMWSRAVKIFARNQKSPEQLFELAKV